MRKVREVLADSVVTEAEREQLVDILQGLIAGTIETLGSSTQVTQLIFDEIAEVRHSQSRFCLTGDFVY